MEWSIKNEKELNQVVDWIVEQMTQSAIFCLEGDLGAGKTTLVRFLANRLGIGDEVNSPTFSLVNEYRFQNENQAEKTLFHIDLYRLESIEEAIGIGIEEYLESGSFCFIEWPELIQPLLPLETVRIQITTEDEGIRKIRTFRKEEV